jgi:hypothetical protein
MTGGLGDRFVVGYCVEFIVRSWIGLIDIVMLAGRFRFAGLYLDQQKAFQIRSAPRQKQQERERNDSPLRLLRLDVILMRRL